MKLALSITIACAFLFTLLITEGTAYAEDEDVVSAGPRVTIDPNISLPVGGLADVAGFGFGATGAIRLPLNAQIGISGRTGFIYHLPKNDITTFALPLYAGLSYGFKPSEHTPYIAAEFGTAYLRSSGGALPEAQSGAKLAATLGGGYRLSFADLRAGLQVYNFSEFGDSLGLFATISFRIAKF